MEQPGFCQSCGAALAPGSRFCESCGKAVAFPGAPIEPATPGAAPAPPSGSGLGRGVLLLSGSALLVACILVILAGVLILLPSFRETTRTVVTVEPKATAQVVPALPATAAPVQTPQGVATVAPVQTPEGVTTVAPAQTPQGAATTAPVASPQGPATRTPPGLVAPPTSDVPSGPANTATPFFGPVVFAAGID